MELKGAKMVGLPKMYQPAEFDLKAGRIRIGSHCMQLKITPLLESLFKTPHQLEISASWYPEGSTPYILFRIIPHGRDFKYVINLNLDTLEFQGLSVELQESESRFRLLAIALDEIQKEDIRKSVQILK